MTGPLPPEDGLARAYLSMAADVGDIGVISLEDMLRQIQTSRVAAALPPVPDGDQAPLPVEGGGGGPDAPVVGDAPPPGEGDAPVPPGEDGPPVPPDEDGVPLAPPPDAPLPDAGPVPGPVGPVVPATVVTAADLEFPAVAALRNNPAENRRTTWQGTRYVIDGRDVFPVALEWCRAAATPGAVLAALRQYQRLRGNGANPALPQNPALPEPRADGLLYGADRHVSPNFEFWVNHVFDEVDNAYVAMSVKRLLLGVDEDGAPAYRLMPRDEAETAERAQEVQGHDGLAPRRWIDDDEAATVMDILVRYGYLVMPAVNGAGPRAQLLRPVGANTSGVDQHLSIGYHGTARAPLAVQASNGAAPRATWAYQGIDDQPWRPFSPGRGRHNSRYFRIGKGDNELETTVSLAQRPHESLDFPLVSQLLYDVPALRPALLANGPLAPGDYGTITISAQGVPSDQLWIYVVRVDNLYDTRGIQEQRQAGVFRTLSSEQPVAGAFAGDGEVATGALPWGQHIGALRYVRSHLGRTREDGLRYHLAEVRDFLGDPTTFEDADRTMFYKFYTGWLRSMPLVGMKLAGRLLGAGPAADNEQRGLLAAAAQAAPAVPDVNVLLSDVTRRLGALPAEDQRDEPQQQQQAAALAAVRVATRQWLAPGEGNQDAWGAAVARMTRMGNNTLALPHF